MLFARCDKFPTFVPRHGHMSRVMTLKIFTMAIAQLSGIGVTEIRNKLGNQVFTRNRAGQIVRAWVNPTNTPSAHRTNARNNFASAVSLWASLSSDEVEQWRIFGQRFTKTNSIAQKYRPSARAIFIECNMNLLAAGQAPISSPLFNAMPSILKSGVFSDLSGGAVSLALNQIGDSSVIAADNVLLVSCSPCVSAGINYPKNFFQHITTAFEGAGLYNFGITSEYVANYGATVSGKAIFARCWFVHAYSGVASKPIVFKGIVP